MRGIITRLKFMDNSRGVATGVERNYIIANYLKGEPAENSRVCRDTATFNWIVNSEA